MSESVTKSTDAHPLVELVKARLREVSLADAQSLAEAALQCGSAAEVRELIAGGGQRTPQE